MKNLIRLLRLVILGFVFLVLCTSSSRAFNKVSSPDVTEGLLGIEYRGGFDFDDANSKNHQEVDKFVANYGITGRLRVEVKGDYTGKSNNMDWSYAEFATRWQIFKSGESRVRLSVQENYKVALQDALPDKLEQSILAATDTGSFTHTVNLNFENELGARATGGTDFNIGWKTLYNYDPRFAPGIETYIDTGKFRSPSSVTPDKYQVGPVVAGKFADGFKYEVGYLFGANAATTDGRVKCILMYDF